MKSLSRPSNASKQAWVRPAQVGSRANLPDMAPFTPLDGSIYWSIQQGIEASRGYVGIFGTDSSYEAYLFVLAVKQSGGGHLLGAGCSEKEVEDLVESAVGPPLLSLVDRIAKDCGVALVRRLKERRPELRALLLVNSQEAYARNPRVREVYDGITAAGLQFQGERIGVWSWLLVTDTKNEGIQLGHGWSTQACWNALSTLERGLWSTPVGRWKDPRSWSDPDAHT